MSVLLLLLLLMLRSLTWRQHLLLQQGRQQPRQQKGLQQLEQQQPQNVKVRAEEFLPATHCPCSPSPTHQQLQRQLLQQQQR